MWQNFKKYGWLCLRSGLVVFGVLAIIGLLGEMFNAIDGAYTQASSAWNKSLEVEETAKLAALDVSALRQRLTRLQAAVDAQGAELRTLRLKTDTLNKHNVELEKAVGWLAELGIALADGSAELDSIPMEEPQRKKSAIQLPEVDTAPVYIPLGGTTLEDVYKARQRAIAAGR